MSLPRTLTIGGSVGDHYKWSEKPTASKPRKGDVYHSHLITISQPTDAPCSVNRYGFWAIGVIILSLTLYLFSDIAGFGS